MELRELVGAYGEAKAAYEAAHWEARKIEFEMTQPYFDPYAEAELALAMKLWEIKESKSYEPRSWEEFCREEGVGTVERARRLIERAEQEARWSGALAVRTSLNEEEGTGGDVA